MIKKIIKKITPRFLISWYHFCLAFLAALVYGFPSRKLFVIGVTGTHGKTTVVNLTTATLENAGYKVASASSIAFRIAGKEEENKLKMTMPGRGVLQKFLYRAVRAGCQYVILEATSEGTLQHRHRFIKFKAMVFTNLFREHLERHGGFENYRLAKAEYFKRCKGIHIINIDDQQAEYFLKFSSARKIGYGLKRLSVSSFQTIVAQNVETASSGLRFLIDEVEFYLRLRGKFNVYNALAAIAIAKSQGISLKQCRQALEQVKSVPGRMEQVISQPFKVVVDYAFTPDALLQVYKTLKQNSQSGSLICVLGACGGGRDKWKRPELGKIASQYCREIIITNEDPYDEDPIEIVEQVAQGADKKARKILDRRQAINKALRLAQADDTVIITGKGCEPWIMLANGKKMPWDDRQVAREEFVRQS